MQQRGKVYRSSGQGTVLCRSKLLAACVCAAALLPAGAVLAQTDPGPRGGPAGAGGVTPGLDTNTNNFFIQALDRFQEQDTVPTGLGPGFNSDSCSSCHAAPAIGGTSPAVNPQVAVATRNGATNTVPSFIRINGPVREARFVSTNTADINAPLDGGVHDLFSIKGRADAAGCNLPQPNFPAALAAGNVIFRIPTPVFGLGFVEATPDRNLKANLASTASRRAALGIGGTFNTNGNDGTITRFGWKAQNKSLQIFTSEAYNVEQGVSDEGFPNERNEFPGCNLNQQPEDSTPFTNPNTGGGTGTTSEMSSDTVNFSGFMRLLAPPTPSCRVGVNCSASVNNGSALFSSVGCSACHSPNLTTGPSIFSPMSNVTFHPFSDFAVHHMGSNLTDGTNQGGAGPDQFRTAPLWGVGQRLFFLHDGRASDLLAAIQAHSSPGDICVTTQDFQQFTINGGISYFQPFSQSQSCGSEANTVISNFNGLSASQKQDVLNFLRTL